MAVGLPPAALPQRPGLTTPNGEGLAALAQTWALWAGANTQIFRLQLDAPDDHRMLSQATTVLPHPCNLRGVTALPRGRLAAMAHVPPIALKRRNGSRRRPSPLTGAQAKVALRASGVTTPKQMHCDVTPFAWGTQCAALP